MTWVYFIRPVGAEGPVKIGCSAMPQVRLANYLPWSPIPLEIAAITPGDFELERRLHSRFMADHRYHEWFRASPELLALIEDVRAGLFNPATVPALNNPGWRFHDPGGRWMSDDGLECQRLSRALKNVREARGLQAPGAVDHAMRVIRRTEDGDRAEAVETVKAYLAAPSRDGIPIQAEWAERLRARAA